MRTASWRPLALARAPTDAAAAAPAAADGRPHLRALVVAAQQKDAGGVQQLEGEQRGHNLQAWGRGQAGGVGGPAAGRSRPAGAGAALSAGLPPGWDLVPLPPPTHTQTNTHPQ